MSATVWIDRDGTRRIRVYDGAGGYILFSVERARAFAASMIAAADEAEGGPAVATVEQARCDDGLGLAPCSLCRGERDIVIGPRQSSCTVDCPACMPCKFDSPAERQDAMEQRSADRSARADSEHTVTLARIGKPPAIPLDGLARVLANKVATGPGDDVIGWALTVGSGEQALEAMHAKEHADYVNGRGTTTATADADASTDPAPAPVQITVHGPSSLKWIGTV